LSEITINIDTADPIDFFGVNNSRLSLLKKAYPKLKLSARGNKIKITGSESESLMLQQSIENMVDVLDKYGNLTDETVEKLLSGDSAEEEKELHEYNDDVLVYGVNGMVVKAKSPNQRKMVELSEANDIVFAIGPAGTGKTYTAVALAVRSLKNKMVKKIVLVRPAVEAGETLGFLPGDIKEKVDPYLRPMYDALDDMIPIDKLNYYMNNRVIEIAPLAFMRGRTLDNAFIILDEAQNTTDLQVKMLLTRLGASAKCIVTGDLTQIDLPNKQRSGLETAMNILKDIEGIGTVYLNEGDVIRHKLVKKIITAYDKHNVKETNKKS
jgi:phosphate starvation-inducible PhoH-like protein